MLIDGLNPKILKWARERQGYSIDDIAEALNKKTDDIRRWESGEDAPTYVQLEKLAYQYYKRPLALFFFPTVPIEPKIERSFRTLPNYEIEKFIPDTHFALRIAKAMQINLYELNGSVNPSKIQILKKLRIVQGDAIKSAEFMREFIGIPLDDQFKWKNSPFAFEAWRDTIQELGIFVFKKSFKQKDISGFCLYDQNFPIIYINNSSPFSRQIFTLFHELAHLLCHSNGVTKTDDDYVDDLRGDDKSLEVFCNRLANEFLVPSADFENRIPSDPQNEEEILKLAVRYRVSREVILRKLYDRKLVDQTFYEAKRGEWNEAYKKYKEDKKKNSKGGGNWYLTQATYLGTKYLQLTFSKYYQQKFSIDRLADYLSINAKCVPGLEQLVVKKHLK